MEPNNHFDAIVIGGGPAGLSAGIYLSRSRQRTLIVNEGTVGGQMILTHEIANYPGVENVSGYQLANIMKKQAKAFGCQIQSNAEIEHLDLVNKPKSLTLSDGKTFTAESIILSPGGRSRTLDVPGEAEFKGRGISYCATCDGDFFTNKEIVVIGGGNTALDEAVSLTKYASKVTLIHKSGTFRASEHAIKEAKSNPKIQFMLNTTVTAFHGNDRLERIEIKNVLSNETSWFTTEGAFIFIGYTPNTEFLTGKVALNHHGEIVVDRDMGTDIMGVFAAGDSISKRFRQITTAVSDGTVAALAASEFLDKHKTNPLPTTCKPH